MSELRVMQGENAWRLLRTDRDAVSRDEVIDTAGAYMKWALGPAQPTLGDPLEIIPTGPGQWSIGAARPVQVERASQKEIPMPPGSLLGSRQSSLEGTIPTVNAETPWWVLVRFFWRGQSTNIPWPSLKVSLLGFREREHTAADWTVDRAVAITGRSELEPDDRDWVDRQLDRAGEVVEQVGKKVRTGVKVAAGVLVAALVVYGLSRARERRIA